MWLGSRSSPTTPLPPADFFLNMLRLSAGSRRRLRSVRAAARLYLAERVLDDAGRAEGLQRVARVGVEDDVAREAGAAAVVAHFQAPAAVDDDRPADDRPGFDGDGGQRAGLVERDVAGIPVAGIH